MSLRSSRKIAPNQSVLHANEALESRRLLAAPPAVFDLTIMGTSGPDEIALSVDGANFMVAMNGTMTPYPRAGVTTIGIDALEGNDLVNVEQFSGAAVYAIGGSGDDQMHLAPTGKDLAAAVDHAWFYGGEGVDEVYAWDSLAGGGNASRTYAFTATGVTGNFGGFDYDDTVEDIALFPTGGVAIINVLSTSSTTALSVHDTGAHDSVNIGGAGGVQNIHGPVTVEHLLGQHTSLTVNNTGDTIARTGLVNVDGDFTSLTGLAPAAIRWAHDGVDRATITTGSAADTVRIFGTRSQVYVESVGGNDKIVVGAAANGAQNILGDVQVDNMMYYTSLWIDDTGNTAARTATLDGITQYSRPFDELTGLAPAAIRYDALDILDVAVVTGGGDDVVNILRSSEQIAFDSSGGNDLVTLGNSVNGLRQIISPVKVSNANGLTTLTLDGQFDAVGRTAVINLIGGIGSVIGLAPAKIDWTAAQMAEVRVIRGASADQIDVRETGACPISLNTSGPIESLSVNGDGTGTALVFLTSDVARIGTVTIGTGGEVRIGQRTATIAGDGQQILVARALQLAGSATFDLTDGSMVLDYDAASPIETIAAKVGNASAGGTWTGAGVTSRFATSQTYGVGYGEAADLLGGAGTFHGVAVDDSSVLVTFTRYGDANLDRMVNIVDFSRLASHFNQVGLWASGNFNYDTNVNIADFSMLAGNFNAGVRRGLSNTLRLFGDRRIERVDGPGDWV